MTESWNAERDADLVPVLKKEIVPGHEVRTVREEGAWNRFRGGLRSFVDRFIVGYAWGQIDRLREAKVREIESVSEERAASAAMLKAEARRLDAEAEVLYARAEEARLESYEKATNIAAREAELRRAIARIEQMGGSVSIVGDTGEIEE
jgi:hypothetical protein